MLDRQGSDSGNTSKQVTGKTNKTGKTIKTGKTFKQCKTVNR